MKKRRWYAAAAAVFALAALTAANFATAGGSSQQLTKVTFQSKWVVQSQFAGYYVAKAKGYYTAVGLDVTIKPGGPDISPEQVVLGGQAQIGTDWMPSLLSQRDTGNDLVNIGQVYARSGTTEVTFKSSGINTFKKMKGKKFGVWILGNEFEQQAALVKNGLDPKKDVTLVKQNFDMVAFLNKEIDAASAMTYNELAQVLETKNPDTGKLYTLKDLNVFKMSNVGTGMLQDGIFVKGDWLKSKANQATATKFLQASFRGWIYCRTHVKECVNVVLGERPGFASRPPDVADERGEQAHLAEQAGGRDHGSRAVRDHVSDRAEVRSHQEEADCRRVRDEVRQGRRRSAEEAGHRRERQELQADSRQAEGRRQVSHQPREGDPQCPCSSKVAAWSLRPTTTSPTCSWTASGSPSSASRWTSAPIM